MNMQYRAKEGEVLDEICWRHYGRESSIVEVLEANKGLADISDSLPAGTVIELPDLAEPEKSSVKLWD